MQQTSSSREMEGGKMNIVSSQSQQQEINGQSQSQSQQQYQECQNDDFIEQMLSTIPNCPWPPTPHDLPSPSSNPTTDNDPNNPSLNFALKPGDLTRDDPDASAAAAGVAAPAAAAAFQYPFDEAALVAKLRQQQMNDVTAKSLLLQQQQQFLLSHRSPADAMLSLPLSLGNPDTVDNSSFRAQAAAEASVQALYNGLAGSVVANGQTANQQHFHPRPPTQGGSLGGGQNCRGQGAGVNQASPASASTGGNNGSGTQQKQRVRARRGQATDPHSIAERLRRERIAERMKALQELVPNANKTDKASMLDEIIDYVKFLQLQVKVLSMSRLGGAAAVAPLVADMTSEGGVAQNMNGNQTTSTNDSLTVSEHQVAKLLEEDMSSAMQYLQGKGLCLMPISLASAINTATSISHAPNQPHVSNNGNIHDINANNNNHPFISSMSSTNGEGDDPTRNASVKDPSNS